MPSAGASKNNRGTLFVEAARIINVEALPGEQFAIRLDAPKTAATASPGTFVHIQCDNMIMMRRPLSIMRANPNHGWIEVLYKILGKGLKALTEKKPGEIISSIGPIGKGFTPNTQRPKSLLIGGGVGIPPMIFLAEYLKNDNRDWDPVMIMGSEIPFPFKLAESKIPTPWLAENIVNTMPLMEKWLIPTRLASLNNFAGTYRGFVTGLANQYIESLSSEEREMVEIFACGPTPMLKAVAELAEKFNLACQISLEEFMACAVGGCAGCTVLTHNEQGTAMKRVCVDGPVFNAKEIFTD